MLDKRRSERHEWRISERTFFIWAFAFGAVGVLLGMRVFRHKTRHWAFQLKIAVVVAVRVIPWLRIEMMKSEKMVFN